MFGRTPAPIFIVLMSLGYLCACGDDDTQRCASDRACNLGEICLDGFCAMGSRTPDTGVQPDGGPDASLPDSGPDAPECTSDTECDDGNDCTAELCRANECTLSALAMGTPCMGGLCNGDSDAPACVECTVDSQCEAGTCNLDTHTCAADCDDDAGCDDGMRCTGDLCISGSCVNTPLPEGRACPPEAGAMDGVCREDTHMCVSCVSNAQCDGATPTCDDSNTCVGCGADADCDDDNECTRDTCGAGTCAHEAVDIGNACDGGACNAAQECVECVSADQCSGDTPVCDTSAATCVACVGDSDCSAPEQCQISTNTCVSCMSADDCDDDDDCTADTCAEGVCGNAPLPEGSECAAGVCLASGMCVACLNNDECSGATPTCNTTTHSCVSCLTDAQCDDSNDCTADQCMGGTCTNANAVAGTDCAAGVCDGISMCVACLSSADCGAQQCDTVTRSCVECLVDADCPEAGATCGPTNTCLSCVGPTCPGVPEHLWAGVYDSGGTDIGQSVAYDSMGNLVVAGNFTGTFSLPLPGGLATFTSRGADDMFVFKIDAAGTFLWAKTFGSIGADSAEDLVIDDSDQIYLIGRYAGSSVNVGGADFPYTDGDGSNVFALSFTSGGGHRWSRGFAGTGSDYAGDIAVYGGSVLLVGGFTGTFTSSASEGEWTSIDAHDAFVLQLQAADGLTDWGQRYGGMGTQIADGTSANATGDSIFVAGSLTNEIEASPSITLIADGTNDLFVLKLQTSGTLIDAVHFGGLHSTVRPWDLAVSSSGQVLVSGFVYGMGTVRFVGPAASASGRLGDSLILALDSNLSARWYHIFPTSLAFAGRFGLAVEGDQVLMAGHFSETVMFGDTTRVSAGSNDVYLTSMSATDGGLHWTTSFGSTDNDRALGLAVRNGQAAITGHVGGDTDFGSGVVPAGADLDLFLSTYRIR